MRLASPAAKRAKASAAAAGTEEGDGNVSGRVGRGGLDETAVTGLRLWMKATAGVRWDRRLKAYGSAPVGSTFAEQEKVGKRKRKGFQQHKLLVWK